MKEVSALFDYAILAACVGAAFTLGTAMVCKLLKWAPVTINVTVNNQRYDKES